MLDDSTAVVSEELEVVYLGKLSVLQLDGCLEGFLLGKMFGCLDGIPLGWFEGFPVGIRVGRLLVG